MTKFRANISKYKRFASLMPPLIGVFLIFFLGRETLEHPLLEDHCKKTAKSVEVAYNMVRYGDGVTQYVDWRSNPSNPYGKLGTIFKYESPLSAYLLAGLYLIVDGRDFNTRVKTTRYFALASLMGAYLLLWFFVFRKRLLAFTVFSVLVVYSFFPIYYSTKPQAETFSLLYQALFIVITARLLQSKKRIGYQMMALVGLVGLLVLGGKMNYFIVAFPAMVCFPLLGDNFKDRKSKLFYYSCFGGVTVTALLVLNLLPGFDLKQIFLYMIKGNKPVIEDSLFATFIEGFGGFSTVWKRMRSDFGAVTFWGGILGSAYLVTKSVYLFRKMRTVQLSKFESAQLIFFLVLVGHALNYVVLRNLFIPHRYYVVPLYPVICLALTVFVADVHSFGCNPSKLTNFLSSKWSGILRSLPSGVRDVLLDRSTLVKCTWRLSLVFFFFGFAVHEFGEKMLRDEEFRSWYVHTIQYFGSSGLTFLLEKQALKTADFLIVLGNAFLIAAGSIIVLATIAGLSKKVWSSNILVSTAKFFDKAKMNTLSISTVFAIIVAGIFSTLENTELFYDNAVKQQKNILLAASIANVREDTKSGDLVLCWKPCIAFYADKRSIIEPKSEDLDYYIENDVHSLLGPIQPFDAYYTQLKKYQRPATYYKLRKTSEIENIRNSKAQKKALKQ